MKKKIKIILAGFGALILAGGTLLGLFNYFKEREARQAFNNFYGNGQVKGAYVSLGGQSLSELIFFFVGGFIFAFAFIILVHHYYKKNKAPQSHAPDGEIKDIGIIKDEPAEKKRLIRLG